MSSKRSGYAETAGRESVQPSASPRAAADAPKRPRHPFRIVWISLLLGGLVALGFLVSLTAVLIAAGALILIACVLLAVHRAGEQVDRILAEELDDRS